MSAIWLGPHESYIVIPPTVVRDAFCRYYGIQKVDCDGYRSEQRKCCPDCEHERIIPASLDLGEPCPTCKGGRTDGSAGPIFRVPFPRCSTCGGSGSIDVLWLAKPCEACDGTGDRHGVDEEGNSAGLWPCPECDGRGHDGVVARCPVQKLPAFHWKDCGDEENPPADLPYLTVGHSDGKVYLITQRFGGHPQPWAQGLQPGALVLKVGEPEPLDEPITECVGRRVPGDDPRYRLPLSHALVPGLNEVELP